MTAAGTEYAPGSAMHDHREHPSGSDGTAAWEQLASSVIADYDVFRVRRRQARSARNGAVHTFHVLDTPSCVNVLPLTADGRVILVEQFRQGVQRVTLEFPAGIVEDGEDPIRAAVRELEEETGYRAASAERLVDLDPDPAIQSSPVVVVVAHGCTGDGVRDQDDGEDVRVRVVAESEVPALLRTGAIRHALAVGAWYHYEQRLRRAGR